MADIMVNQSDLEALAKKLDELGELLSEKECALLLAVFKLASLAISGKLGGQGGQSGGGSETEIERGSGFGAQTVSGLPPLSLGFSDAFKPLSASTFNVRDIESVAGGVGIGVVW